MADSTLTQLQRLEKYTAAHPQEVLLLTAEVAGETDQIAIFRGFSSSLVRATAFDPDIPLLPETARIVRIDRLHAPYNPDAPRYIETNLTWDSFSPLLHGI